MKGKRKFIVAAIVLALIIGFYFLISGLISSGTISRYYSKLINLVLIYVIAAVSLNLTCGFLGQLPLGHAGFMAIGAYTSAIITTNGYFTNLFGINNENIVFVIATLAGGLVAAMFGVIIGLPALRLKGDYLAIITLGFGEIIRVILQNMEITGGAMGLSGISKYTNFGWAYFWTVICIIFTYFLINSVHGRSILSVREDEIAAESCGIDTTYYKTFAFAAAAFFGGVSGSLLAHHIGYLEPSNFGYSESIDILVMVVLGGLGSITGSVIAATVLTVLPELLYAFSDWRMIIYSLLLVIVMIFRPSGLLGNFKFSSEDIKREIDKITHKEKEEK